MELVDVYDDNAQLTGRVVERGSKDFKEGEHIAVAIIYIENSNHEFLIQKTSKEKGGQYSSTGGHIDHGEKPMQTIKREVKEELGIDIEGDNVVDLGYLCVDFPIRFCFYLKKDIDIKDIKIQEDEVESVSYKTVDEIKNLIDKGLMHPGHAKVLDKVLEYLENK
ncbi:MAG: NUDIX hydrolase [Clostridia bacterium]|nr:NUDIX hydrolase [Clostridia bacterium]